MKRKKVLLSTTLGFIPLMFLLLSTIVIAQEGAPIIARWYWPDTEISDVFEQISRSSGVDFVVEPSISGKITLSARNKSWKDIVNIICNMKELVAIDEDGYMFIIKERDYYRRIKNKETDKKQIENTAELKKIVVKLKHTTIESMEKPVKGLLTKRGKVVAVPHTNSLIIHEVESNIPVIKDLISKLDVELKQISISAKIVEVSSSMQKQLGIQWSAFDGRVSHLPNGPGVANATGTLTNVAFGILTQQAFSVTLDYLAADGSSDMVAQPQITTLDNKEAEISMGSEVPYNRVDEGGNTTTEYIEVKTGLKVTPHIMGNGKIMMDVNPQKQSYDIDGNNNIIKKDQSATTAVVVNNGETIVIAGLTSDEKTEANAGVPVLKNIPILGHLFKSSAKKHDKKDLIIFVTPHIISTVAGSTPADGAGVEVATPDAE